MVRGPLLSGALGSEATLAAILRLTAGRARVVVLGPPWLGAAVSTGGAVLALVEAASRPIALRTRRRARKLARPLDVALAGAELPFARGVVDALVIENVAALTEPDAARWLSALVPCLRAGGRLIAADPTSSDEAAARVSAVFMSASLTAIEQEWPRDGAVLTVGVAPDAAIVAARFGLPA